MNGETDYWAGALSSANSYVSDDVELLASLKGTNTITAKKDYASASQKIDAKGAVIDRGIGAGYYDSSLEGGEGVNAYTRLFRGFEYYNDQGEWIWQQQVPAASSSLNGQSTATITAKSGSLKGTWRAYLAKDLTTYPEGVEKISFWRSADSYDDFEPAYANFAAGKSSLAGPKSFSFTESASVKAGDATAA